jgi:hypothetical protein
LALPLFSSVTQVITKSDAIIRKLYYLKIFYLSLTNYRLQLQSFIIGDLSFYFGLLF